MANDSSTGNWFYRIFSRSDAETTYLHKGEILFVFLLGCLIAVSLWLLVNLGKEFHLTVNIPLEITNYSDGMAFSTPPPDEISIGVSGIGWNLVSLYRNPPGISIRYEEGLVDITEIVQSQLASYSDVTVQKVNPSFITVEMEPIAVKRVPVIPDLDVRLKTQYEISGFVRVSPDSVTVSGAESIIDTINFWPTERLQLRNVQQAVNRSLHLASLDGIHIRDTTQVDVAFDVTEFTEGEIRIYVRARNVPDGQQIRFNPSVISVRYDVPIEFFSEAQEAIPYEAFVNFSDILRDTTGFVVPDVRPTMHDINLRLRSFQPRRVSYFKVISE